MYKQPFSGTAALLLGMPPLGRGLLLVLPHGVSSLTPPLGLLDPALPLAVRDLVPRVVLLDDGDDLTVVDEDAVASRLLVRSMAQLGGARVIGALDLPTLALGGAGAMAGGAGSGSACVGLALLGGAATEHDGVMPDMYSATSAALMCRSGSHVVSSDFSHLMRNVDFSHLIVVVPRCWLRIFSTR